jgi:hypothetical protein
MISNEEISQIIEKNRELDKKQLGVKRKEYLSEIMPFLDRKETIILKGIRRSGKSTIMKQIMQILIKEKKVSKDNIIYVNLEEYKFLESLDLELLDALLNFWGNKKQKLYLFLDEIQLIPKWEKWIRTYYDRQENIKFIVSGSCSSLLDQEYSTALTGRNITFKVNPLSFTEFETFKGGNLEDYLEFGGFPEIVLEQDKYVKKKLLKQYIEDVVNKDIINRHGIRNSRQVYLLIKYLSSNTGQKVSFNKIAKSFGLSVETVIRYIQYMVEAYLIYEVPFHSYSVKVKYDKSKSAKYYLADNGFMDILGVGFSKNVDKRCENSVLLKLKEQYDPTYWQGEKEVDFVFEKTGLNVTVSDKIAKREFEGLIEIKKKDKNIEKLVLINPSLDKQENDIMLVPLKSFLNGKPR